VATHSALPLSKNVIPIAPMVIASHVIFGAYGFWLPNDPRGSWSEFVRSWELFRDGGPASKTESRRSVANEYRDPDWVSDAIDTLKYPTVQFDGPQARAIGRGFAAFAEKRDLRIFACAILPEHIHLVIGRHRYEVEQVVTLLKGEATRRLEKEHRHPMTAFPLVKGRRPSCWARGEWKVFLNRPEDVARAVDYVENNPAKEGLRRQNWRCVTDWRALVSR
jgi:REP element-mobilizing transposase RayT